MTIWRTNQAALKDLTAKQERLLERAEAEKRKLTQEEEMEYQTLQRAFTSIKEHTSLYEPFEEREPYVDPKDKRSVKTETTRLDFSRPEVRELVNYMVSGKIESRALQADLDLSGGFLVLPEYLTSDIIHDLDNQVFIRPLATKFRVKAESVGIPVMDTDVSDPRFTGEVTQLNLDTAMDFEKRRLIPHRLCKGIKWSRTLQTIGTPNVAQFIASRLIYKLAVVEENEFLNGDGASSPLGLFTTSANGVSSSRNVSEGNSTTEIKADNLISTAYFLKAQYLADPSCRWIFHRTVMKQLKKLKDGDGNYLFSIDAAGIPRILGIPVIMSEYAPSTMTSGLRVGMLGALRFYGIAEFEDYKIQTLTELYALTNQNATLIEKWVDGGPLLEEAFAAVTLA